MQTQHPVDSPLRRGLPSLASGATVQPFHTHGLYINHLPQTVTARQRTTRKIDIFRRYPASSGVDGPGARYCPPSMRTTGLEPGRALIRSGATTTKLPDGDRKARAGVPFVSCIIDHSSAGGNPAGSIPHVVADRMVTR